MRKRFRKILILLLLVILLIGATMPVASSNTSVGESPPMPGEESPPMSGGESTSMSGSVNPLTGEPMDEYLINRRPLAISMSNAIAALPMNGISQADIVFEVLVESNITRMLALYQDISDVGPIGSIRSARHYTVQLAAGYDAIFVSAGGSPQGYAEVEALGVSHLDEVAGAQSEMFYRDVNRIRGKTLQRYHSAVTTGELVTRWLPGYGFRMFHHGGYTNALSFANNARPAGGGSANDVIVRFATGNSSSFSYKTDRNIYHMRQFDMDFVDANDYSQPAFTNILVLRTSVSPIPGDGAGRLDIITTGKGTGYFANGGMYTEIDWSRAGKSSPFIFTLKDGTALHLGRGKTYIGIIPAEMNVTFR